MPYLVFVRDLQMAGTQLSLDLWLLHATDRVFSANGLTQSFDYLLVHSIFLLISYMHISNDVIATVS